MRTARLVIVARSYPGGSSGSNDTPGRRGFVVGRTAGYDPRSMGEPNNSGVRPSLGLAALAGAVNGLYVAAGWTQLRDARKMAVAAVAGAVVGLVAEAARFAATGTEDVSATLGVSGVASIGSVFAGLSATGEREKPSSAALRGAR